MNEAIQRFVDELAADPAVRGIILFGSHARANARADSDADLVILGERDQFEMGFAERDGQKFELLRWSEAVAIRYAMDNRDNAAEAADGRGPAGVVALGVRGPARRGGRARRGRPGGRPHGPARTDHRPDGDVLRCARAVDAPAEAAAGTDRRPRSASAPSAHRDLRGRRVIHGPAGARPPNAPAHLRRGDHLTSSCARSLGTGGGPMTPSRETCRAVALDWDESGPPR